MHCWSIIQIVLISHNPLLPSEVPWLTSHAQYKSNKGITTTPNRPPTDVSCLNWNRNFFSRCQLITQQWNHQFQHNWNETEARRNAETLDILCDSSLLENFSVPALVRVLNTKILNKKINFVECSPESFWQCTLSSETKLTRFMSLHPFLISIFFLLLTHTSSRSLMLIRLRNAAKHSRASELHQFQIATRSVLTKAFKNIFLN